MVICPQQGTSNLHMVQLMLLPPFTKIQTGLTIPMSAYPGCPRKKTAKQGVYLLILCLCSMYNGLSCQSVINDGEEYSRYTSYDNVRNV